VSYSEGVGIFWPLFQGRNLVGRRGAPDLDITLEEATVSAHHGVLLAAACPGRVKLEDLGSTNGTFVGKARLAPGQRRELSDGDLLRFGAFTAIVKII
jgi:pSer/pThr/pTyr-binding forkhead associated (FHA) protein